MRYFVISLFLPLLLWGELYDIAVIPVDQNSSQRFTQVQVSDAKVVSFDRIDGEKFFGISALAYDHETKILYMLSDRSRLFAFHLTIQNNKIKTLQPIFGRRLRDPAGHKYFLKESDSEGMTLVHENGKKRLWISFEQIPRIGVFDLKGRALRYLSLPKVLQKRRNYRKDNAMLEALTYVKKFGFVTAPELPLRSERGVFESLYSSKGKLCRVPKDRGYALTELETTPDGNLLALYRSVHLKPSLVIGMKLRKIFLDDTQNGRCRIQELMKVTSDDGWVLDNFEGITHIKDDLYLIVSDDNGNFFQKTLLWLVRIR